MKEKTDNIDILEEMIKPIATRTFIFPDGRKEEKEIYNLERKQIEAIENLIAENKELKETVEKRNNKIYELLDRSINALKLINKEEVKQDYIPKSKVEEIIHNNKPHIAQEKLQSLLGKE